MDSTLQKEELSKILEELTVIKEKVRGLKSKGAGREAELGLEPPENIEGLLRPAQNEIGKFLADKEKRAADWEKETEEMEEVFARAKGKPCNFGVQGICCRNCSMGPCRITSKSPKGICGATAETISSRNFARMMIAGGSAHSEYARQMTRLLFAVADGSVEKAKIADPNKLRSVAKRLGIEVNGQVDNQLAKQISKKASLEFGKQEEGLELIKLAPEKRQKIWQEQGVVPRGIEREMVEMLHRTSIGVDQEAENILAGSTRCALACGFGSSMIYTELLDILFTEPALFTKEAITALSGAIKNGQVKGVACVCACQNVRTWQEGRSAKLIKALLKENVLVVHTGCETVSCPSKGNVEETPSFAACVGLSNCAKEGLLSSESLSMAGEGLKEFCQKAGILPVVHFGSCLENSRLLNLALYLIDEGLADDISKLPFVFCAPEWASSKVLVAGQYLVSSGIPAFFGPTFPTGSDVFSKLLAEKSKELYGANWTLEADLEKMAELAIQEINNK